MTAEGCPIKELNILKCLFFMEDTFYTSNQDFDSVGFIWQSIVLKQILGIEIVRNAVNIIQ